VSFVPEESCLEKEVFLCKVFDAKGKCLVDEREAFSKNFYQKEFYK